MDGNDYNELQDKLYEIEQWLRKRTSDKHEFAGVVRYCKDWFDVGHERIMGGVWERKKITDLEQMLYEEIKSSIERDIPEEDIIESLKGFNLVSVPDEHMLD